MDIREINNEIGDIDLNLLDQILKGRISPSDRILDAGCGSGRNLIYFLKQGFDTSAIDLSISEVKAANFMSRNLIGKEVSFETDISKTSFPDNSFDYIVCSRVLHFANSEKEFFEMLEELRRILDSKGTLYLSMDSKIGLEESVTEVDPNKHQFKDGNIRFLLSSDRLEKIETKWKLAEEARTVIFGNKIHGETTLILQPI